MISVLKNLLCDAVPDITNPGGMTATLEESIKEFLTLVRVAEDKRPNVKFALAQLTLRLRLFHQWLTDCHDAVCKKLGEGIQIMDLQNVGKIDGLRSLNRMESTSHHHLVKY
jgi:hypothetical protein